MAIENESIILDDKYFESLGFDVIKQADGKGNFWVYVPEGYEGTIDTEVYLTGAGTFPDLVPYAELAKEGYDKVLVLSNGTNNGTTPAEQAIAEIMKEIDNRDNISIGVTDVNVHSLNDTQAVKTTIKISEAGFTVAHANVFDGNKGLKYFDSKKNNDGLGLKAADWQAFAETGADLNVFSGGTTSPNGVEGWHGELDRLTLAAENGVNVTFSLCDFEGSNNDDEFHAAVSRDVLVNGIMDIFEGKSDTFNFDIKLTKDDYEAIDKNPAYVKGFKYTITCQYNEETGAYEWVPIYGTYKDKEGSTNYAALIEHFASKSHLYTKDGGATDKTDTSKMKSPLTMDVNAVNELANSGNDDILFNYLGITSTVDGIIATINNTAVNNGTVYQQLEGNKSGFPESLNAANKLLFGATSDLLKMTSSDAYNISQILSDFIYLDNKFSDAVGEMDKLFDGGKYFQSDVSIKNANTLDIEGSSFANASLFPNLNPENAGKISMSDIDGILKGNTLIGAIGEGLKNEYEDACNLQNSIEEMINLPQNAIKGKIWEAEKARLEKLSECCTLRKNAVETLESAYINALTLVRDYIGDEPYLDDGELDKYRQDLKNAKAVPAYRGTGGYIHLPNGMSYEITEPNEPEYSNAQAQIPIFEAKITKLEGLANVLNDANRIINEAMAEVNSSYVNAVNGIPEVHIGMLDI